MLKVESLFTEYQQEFNMAKINVYIPEPQPEYSPENFRQINQGLATIENQLNTSFQQDLKNEQDSFNYFMQ